MFISASAEGFRSRQEGRMQGTVTGALVPCLKQAYFLSAVNIRVLFSMHARGLATKSLFIDNCSFD